MSGSLEIDRLLFRIKKKKKTLVAKLSLGVEQNASE